MAGAALLAVYAIWRSTLGVTLLDDSYYVAMALRLARGARVFADERNIQSLGSLLAVPFAKAWLSLVGVSGLALALRGFYLALAAGVGVAVHRSLRPTTGSLPAFAAVVTLLLSPPFNVLAVSYNTMGMLGLAAGVALMFAAVRDRNRGAAIGAVVALGLASLSYATLVVPAALTVAVGLVLARDRRLRIALLATAAATAAVAIGGLLLNASVADMRATLSFDQLHYSEGFSVGFKLRRTWGFMRETLVMRTLWPLWALVAAAILLPKRRWRAYALITFPLAAAVPGVMRIAEGGEYKFFGIYTSAFLITLSLAMVLPVVMRLLRLRRKDELRLVTLAAPAGIAGFLVVAITSAGGWYWGMPAVGLAALSVALVGIWGREIRDAAGVGAAGAAACMLALSLVVLMTGTVFKASRPWTLSERVGTGAYAGISADPGQASAISELGAAARRWVRADTRVFAIGAPGVYPVVGGRIHTPVLWATGGYQSANTIAYFDERGWPDVVFLKPADRLDDDRSDPLIAHIAEEYRSVDEAGGFAVLGRR